MTTDTTEVDNVSAIHPLDPLSADEFTRVTEILAHDRGVGEGWRYASIMLIEPDKETLYAFGKHGEAPTRRVLATLLNTERNATYKAIVSLTAGRTESFDHVPGVQPNFMVDEWEECDALLRADPDVIAALARRGITDMDLVFMDTWTYGAAVMPPEYRDRRIGWSDTWVRSGPGMNPYAHQVSGFHCVVDLNTMEVLRIEDDGSNERPEVMGEYVPRHIPERLRAQSTRPPVKPLEIVQPEGPSFELDGNLLTWQNWSLRVGFNYRESMTLHEVSYDDNGTVRTIANRMSFAEMIVPYRDTTVDHYRRTAFDIGEWGLGFMTTSLELGCDCLGEIRYLDATLHNSKGEPYSIPNAICIHEEDDAIGWKHVDHDAGAEVRRSRRLVVSFHVTVANYEYITYWRFYQDGNIECEVRATGIMVTTPFAPGQQPPTGVLVDTQTYAPFHQHFLVARLDLDIDTTAGAPAGDDSATVAGHEQRSGNTVVMTESYAPPIGPDNPYGLSVVTRNEPLCTELRGTGDLDFHTQRTWKVVNPNVTTALGHHPAYKLVPGGAIPAMFDPAAPVLQRAGIIGHTVWVTANEPEERWPAGEFVNQSEFDTGITEWVKADRNIENTDVVMWYVFGIHHITRPEDWPVMPVDTVSFWLKPFGFFDRNPSLDVPASPPSHCHPGEH
ncbi:primary-amine oxidase [Gordonia jinhuaensis]|uniref:Amine oxidase n=1 Tax=Gordonia jinhuaensis TaxID=1517702 RepID=A0A916SZJ0_9ACTN|nr:primary-amine oxidase [Gordonia jinhuaensis]GGB21585.1 amine oxidase [Gordonia jinhuaensis]